MAVLSARQREWSRARVGVPGVAAFLWLTLLATLLHLDLFHLHAGPATARAAAWAWLVDLYRGSDGADDCGSCRRALPEPTGRAPGSCRLVPRAARRRGRVGGRGRHLPVRRAVDRGAPVAWPLTPLTAQAVAAWLIGYGSVLLTMIVENDWDRVRPALGPSAALFVLQVIALIRYPTSSTGPSPSAWIFLLMLGGALVLGAAGSLPGAEEDAVMNERPRLRVVGAGLPRTGTHSLKWALERLLGGPCYHMSVIPGHPYDLGPGWQTALEGGTPNWNELLDGYMASVDWPVSMFWEPLSAANPRPSSCCRSGTRRRRGTPALPRPSSPRAPRPAIPGGPRDAMRSRHGAPRGEKTGIRPRS